ncbi:MAG: inorganic diphosphatase [Pseudomonadota bacterium]|nr:inorganic diphosphatase [Pseudomonadota bacterium]
MSMDGPSGGAAPPGDAIPARVRVTIEVPRGSFLKRDGARVEYLSPVPCPFNYGCVPDRPAPDGDPLDALVLGPRLAFGAEVDVPVHAVVRFRDDGAVDDKLVCGPAPTPRALAAIAAFFRVYAVARRWMNRARGRRGDTRFLGVERLDTRHADAPPPDHG